MLSIFGNKLGSAWFDRATDGIMPSRTSALRLFIIAIAVCNMFAISGCGRSDGVPTEIELKTSFDKRLPGAVIDELVIGKSLKSAGKITREGRTLLPVRVTYHYTPRDPNEPQRGNIPPPPPESYKENTTEEYYVFANDYREWEFVAKSPVAGINDGIAK